jgi:Phage P2 GpE.
MDAMTLEDLMNWRALAIERLNIFRG